jgi:hypothetical protein
MGLVGLFVGPVLMALLVAVWREWLLTTTDNMTLIKETESPLPANVSDSESVPAIAGTKSKAWSTSDV